jgi:hypothetical protein
MVSNALFGTRNFGKMVCLDVKGDLCGAKSAVVDTRIIMVVCASYQIGSKTLRKKDV